MTSEVKNVLFDDFMIVRNKKICKIEKDVDGIFEDCYGWVNEEDWQVILFEDGSLVILYEDLENSVACRLINKKVLVKKLDYIFYIEQLSPLYIRRNKVLEDLGI